MSLRHMLLTVPLLFVSLATAATAATTTASGATPSSTPQNGSGSTALEIEGIQAHFKNAQLVPNLLNEFNPEFYLELSFSGVGSVQPGQRLNQSQVTNEPTVTVVPANNSVPTNANYSIIMVDADIVGTNEGNGQNRHWLTNSAKLSGTGTNKTVDTSSASNITQYAGPGPASGSGPHRYVVLLYSQSPNFTSPSDVTPTNSVTNISLAEYVQSANLVGPVAGNYFQVEVGTATVSISPTSSVVSSTLSVPSGASTTASATGANAAGNSTPKTGGSIATYQATGLGFGAVSLVFFASVAFVIVA